MPCKDKEKARENARQRYLKKKLIDPDYQKNRVAKYRKENPWVSTFVNIKRRCTDINFKSYKNYGGRGIKCLITTEELKELWFRDKAYNLKEPSIDRIDNDGHYEYGNCRYIEKKYNKPHNTNAKIVLQYDLNGNFIREWESATEAGWKLDINLQDICACARGIQKTAHGSIWRYK